jgi:predicted acylesterase/phospholipase RssA
MASIFRILCIDGGGIRGIIPALVLAEIEDRTGRPIHQLFDLIAGTSTGGILALGLMKPGKRRRAQYTAKGLVQFYEKEGGRIFSRSLLHQVLSVGNLLDKKYQSEPIETVLEEYFGDALLSEALQNVLLTSYDIERREAVFARSYRAKTNDDYDFLMRDLCRATSAAPTYFEPKYIENKSAHYALIDGGVFANNPAMCALVDAIREFKKGLDEIFMVSLGTGNHAPPLDYEKVKNWGVISWAQPILSVVFHGVSDTVHYQTRQIFNEEGKPNRYYRLQIELSEGVSGLDNVANISELTRMAKTLIKERDAEIDAICKALPKKSTALSKKSAPRKRTRNKVAGRARPKRLAA